MSAVAVVLAGGLSRRYGSDKLTADVDGQTLLDRAIGGLHDDREVIIVGPARALTSGGHEPGTSTSSVRVGHEPPWSDPVRVRFVPDDHPDGGPAAAMITGLRAALDSTAELILVLPGDAPGAGIAAEKLAAELARRPESPGLLAVDRSGRDQPLQLALRRPAAEHLVRASEPDGAQGRSARRLVATLDLPRLELDRAATWDIDTARQHRAWVLRDGAAVRAVRQLLEERAPTAVILIGGDRDQVDALADAVELAGDARPTADAADVDGWFTRSLHVPPPHRSATLRIGVGPGPVPDGVELVVS
ncbi:molybdenum cofactor guanylyltransferase [Microlunatus sp. GCM10028923]|uniref:molybdenum cofactor guanylyltransferase n=1 Tax=Microlunatus sp. GCM10028923 TaxID=3273400 RepID=UPI0036197132